MIKENKKIIYSKKELKLNLRVLSGIATAYGLGKLCSITVRMKQLPVFLFCGSGPTRFTEIIENTLSIIGGLIICARIFRSVLSMR